jgi:hypothetical protein
MSSGLVVAEAKSFSTSLRDHIPQVVAEMYGCVKALKLVLSLRNLVYISNRSFYHRKDVIRGALTRGDEWMFFVLIINDNGDGAKYWQSEELSFLARSPGTRVTIEAPWPDIVAGILAHWVCISPFICLPFKRVH